MWCSRWHFVENDLCEDKARKVKYNFDEALLGPSKTIRDALNAITLPDNQKDGLSIVKELRKREHNLSQTESTFGQVEMLFFSKKWQARQAELFSRTKRFPR